MIVDPVEAGEGRDEAELASTSVSKLLSVRHVKLMEFQILDAVFLSAMLDHVMRQITSSYKARFAKNAEDTLWELVINESTVMTINLCNGSGSLSSPRAKIQNLVILIKRSTDLNIFIDSICIHNEVTLLRLGIYLRCHELESEA